MAEGLVADADNDPLSVSLYYGNATRASVKGHIITYDPAGFIGVDDVVYVVDDGNGGSAIASLVFTVSDASAPNQIPDAQAGAFTFTLTDVVNQPEQGFELDLSTWVSDADGDDLYLVQVYAGANPASVSGGLTVRYSASTQVAKDQFWYVVTDGRGGYAQNTVTVSLENQAPSAPSLAYTLDAGDASIDIDLAAHVSDPDGDAVLLTDVGAVSAPATLSQQDLVLTYRPNGVVRTQSIPYTVSDGLAQSSGVITIAVSSTVTAGDLDLGSINMDASAVSVDLSQHISNSAPLEVGLANVVGAKLGVVDFTPGAQSFTYTPKDISHGEDILHYIVEDSSGSSAVGEVRVHLNAPAAPTLNDFTLTKVGGKLEAGVDCQDCDSARTTYQFEVNGVPRSKGSDNTFTPNAADWSELLGVEVTVKNRYCTAQNTGVQGGNACRYARGHALSELEGVHEIAGAYPAFAAIRKDGSVVTWGDRDRGGDSSSVQSELYDVQHIAGTAGAFAAIRDNGSVVTWGDSFNGGDSGSVQSELYDVQHFAATTTAFAAIRADGSVVAWGSGGDSSSVQSELYDVQHIAATATAFAAIRADGFVVTWGRANYNDGGDSSSVQSELYDVQHIAGTDKAFAAIRDNGSVVTWGDSFHGGDSSSVQSELYDVQDIAGTGRAFAAIRADGSVVTWGSGGDSSSVQSELYDVQHIAATKYAFAAIRADGSVVTWGDSDNGGDSSSVQSELYDVQHIAATNYAFAAIRTNGSVVTWGDSYNGGDSSSVQSELYDVQHIAATRYAFAAIRADGSVVTWGSQNFGGDSSSVQSELTPVLKELSKTHL
nr:Ig-like domain-containing protein [Agarivorans sp. B2Z047]